MVSTEVKLTLDLTEAEWTTYLTTIEKAVKTIDPESNLTIWEVGMLKHKDMGVQIHGGTPMFGYSHRYFLRWFELKLQEIDPNFAFFYWDTGKEFNTWANSKIWKYMGEQQGLVTISAFNGIGFKSLNNARLERQCQTSKNPPPSEYFRELWEKTKDKGYGDYCTQLEYAHGVVHNLVGGSKGQIAQLHSSALDPIFYAHHANVDYTLLQAQLLWAQGNYPKDKAYGPLTLKSKIAGFPDKVIGDVLDVADICVSYVPSGRQREPVVEPPVTTTNSTNVNTTSTNNTTVNNTNVNNTIGTGNVNGTNGTILNSTQIPNINVTNSLKNFTLELSDEWVEMSFKNKSQDIKKEAEGIQKTLNEKVDKGETIITNIVSDDQSRAYVGAKADGAKNLKRLENGASSISLGVSALMIVSTMFF